MDHLEEHRQGERKEMTEFVVAELTTPVLQRACVEHCLVQDKLSSAFYYRNTIFQCIKTAFICDLFH